MPPFKQLIYKNNIAEILGPREVRAGTLEPRAATGPGPSTGFAIAGFSRVASIPYHGRMVNRLVISFIGASGITLGLLYGMAQVAEIFERRDPTQYFLITDVLLRPEGARPQRPPRAAEVPQRPPVEFERPSTSLDVQAPTVDLARPGERPDMRPRLEEPAPE